MFHMKHFFYFILIHLIIATPQINLYYTDEVSASFNSLQHNCLRIPKTIPRNNYEHELISYCMSEIPSNFNIENDDFFPTFTFADLSKQNITGEELYYWSAPIDIIEHYQFYLNQLSKSNDLSLANQVFYNCTLPRFGPMCQYKLAYYDSRYSSLTEIVRDFYGIYQYKPIIVTCYIHLKCNRGPYSSCLDWSEICDGEVDCFDGGSDEEHCWQREINECKDNEYRCRNGQCIPQSFYQDGYYTPDCIDSSDHAHNYELVLALCWPTDGPSFASEDTTDPDRAFSINCAEERRNLPGKIVLYWTNNSLVFEDCWYALECLFNFTVSQYSSCNKLCQLNTCINIIEKTCSDMVYVPNVPVLFGNIYFAYSKTDLRNWTSFSIASFYICYDIFQYDDFFGNVSKIFFNNMACVCAQRHLSSQVFEQFSLKVIHERSISELKQLLIRYHLVFNYTSAICNNSNMYQCARSSKCISIVRLIDTVGDCPHQDDESMAAINNVTNRLKHFNKTHFYCPISGTYIHRSYVRNGDCQCERDDGDWCEDEDLHINYLQSNIVFQHICDGFIDLFPITIAGQNETDETECEQWECNNTYTHCNNVWNCLNGADESGCVSDSVFDCSFKQYLCVSPNTNQFICLPIEKVNDGNVDCLGATDEPDLCAKRIQKNTAPRYNSVNCYCIKEDYKLGIYNVDLCDGHHQCKDGDDEQFCTTNRISSVDGSICWQDNHDRGSDVEKFLCDHKLPIRQWDIVDFKFDGMINLVDNQVKNMKNTLISSSSMIKTFDQYLSRCNRGLDLRIWLNDTNNSIRNTCLCPPSYYGNQCQYQNQRISLIIKFRALAGSWQTLFAIVISLIDDSDQKIIHSSEQLNFLSIRDCNIKFNVYLLYSTRPKDPTKNYSIHIDFYEKLSLNYRGSLLLPVKFPFLPIYRLSLIVDIPRSDDKTRSCLNKQCIHGKCIKYSNNPDNFTFCQCDQGWSGKYCTIQHTCTCSSDSLCIGISANNRSICVCPINKFGPRCLLNHTICQNDGLCTSNNDYMIFDQNFVCICKKGFHGNQCELSDNNLTLLFHKDILLSQQMFIHFIEFISWNELNNFTRRETTFRTIPVRQDFVIVHFTYSFHIFFVEFSDKNYYLAILQETYNQSVRNNKTINPSDRCPYISELFNETFVQLHPLRRIKYYHLPCQKQELNLSCFYDNVSFCLCYNFGEKRLANCFNFDHNMTFDCQGQSECENNGQCLQDKLDCPTRSLCICPPCFYGRLCQFSTSGFGLSLDAILGYHILSHVNIIHQPAILQFSLALTIIFIVVGSINGILSLITFKSKIIREVGCGLYLLCSSITTLFITTMFGLKFFILFLSQTTMISNRSFLKVQCHSIDFLLRTSLFMDQWLNACVALERAITTIQGAGFNKRKSKQTAKLVIVILLIVIVGTSIHDPIYRRLIDEENDTDDIEKIWCIISYPFGLQVYNSAMQIFHFFGPFIINFISGIILITKKSHQQLNVRTERTYNDILREQFREHKHLLTAPIVLVILALPRLIITFVSKCMKSANDAWLSLIGYFISFIPAMLTFVVFILPSKYYKKEFHKSIAQYRTNIQRRLHLTS